MKDEIKVILNYLDMYKNMNEGLLNSKDKKLLLDYITNLQQENERLKDELERLHNLLNSQAYRDLEDYKSRCEKASEIIKKEKENMGYAKYDSCLLLIENILQNGSDSQ